MAEELFERRCLICAKNNGNLHQFIAGSLLDKCDFTAVDICEECIASATSQKLVYGIVMPRYKAEEKNG